MANPSESTMTPPNPQSAELYNGSCLHCGGYAFTMCVAPDGSISRKNPYFCGGGCNMAYVCKEYNKHNNNPEKSKQSAFTSVKGEKNK